MSAGIVRPAIIHRDRAEQPALAGYNRRRVTGAQSMGGRKMFEVAPQRITGNVVDEHRLALERRRATRPGRWPDDESVDGFVVGLRQTRSRAVQQSLSCLIGQQHRAKHAVRGLCFGLAHQHAEYLREWPIGRNELEHLLFGGQQRFG